MSLRTLRERWVPFLGTFVIIAAGVTQVAALNLTMAATGRDPAFDGVVNILAMTMMVTTFVSVFVIASTFAFSVAQRQREFALLRTLGSGPRRIAVVVYGEALLVAGAAGALGCVLAQPAATALLALLHGIGMVPAAPPVRYEAAALVLALGTGVTVSLAGVWGPARRIRRIKPIEALREASVDARAMTPGRWVLGLGCAAMSALAGWALPEATGDGVPALTMGLGMSAIVAMGFLSPVVIPPLAAALTWPLGGLPGGGAMVVRAGMSAAVRRTASLCAPVLLTVGLFGIAIGLVSVVNGVAARAMAEWTSAEFTVTATGGGGLSADQVARLRALPGAQVAVVREAEIGMGGAAHVVRVVDPEDAAALIDPPAEEGDFAALGADGVAVDAATAGEYGWGAGDEVRLRLPDGERVRARVAAVLAEGPYTPVTYVAAPLLAGHGGGTATAPYAYVGTGGGAQAAAGHRADGAVAGTGAAGGDLEERLEAAVDADTARTDPVGAIEPGREENNRMVLLIGAVLLGMALFCSCVAIANTLVMSTADRVRDFAALRLAGADRAQVLRLVAGEAVAVVGIGAFLGTAVTAMTLVPLAAAMGEGPAGVALSMPWWQLGVMTGVCAVIAVAAAVVPAAFATRTSPVQALGARE
ncbi:putative ABC transport system permease protein [Streptomonospora nanhaiensis]|uniref:Putative ABC transport system permease protein n=1 Tax=Streptomonospora nanhaiensis TaxID=1323731 RepID=A0A853BMH2_9ACTN|nr:ABC transporter permease [Streptomonospora nanhaiensis]NYI96789.1 putative ABC transport system permease protein [Streptomonospora nanhaiensis]